MKTALRNLTLVLFIALGLVSCNKSESGSIITLTSDNFPEETASGVVLVDFWADWCMPCKAMSPVINELANQLKGKIKVGKVDIDSEQALAKQFNVQAIPTILILKDGEIVETQTGITSKEALVSLLEKHISLE